MKIKILIWIFIVILLCPAVFSITSTFTSDSGWNTDPAGDHSAVRFCWYNSFPEYAAFYFGSAYDENTDWEVLLNTSDIVYVRGVMTNNIVNVTLNITPDSHPKGVCIWLGVNLITAAPGNEKNSKSAGDLPKEDNGMWHYGFSEDPDYSDFNNAFMFGEESFGAYKGIYAVDWKNYTAPTPPTTPPDEQTFTIMAKDLYYDSNINNLTITISNSSNKYTYFTQNGTILVSNKTNLQISKFNVTYDIEFSSSQAGGYLNNTHNINLTDGGSFTDKLYQAILYINASEVFSGSGIDEFWALSPLQINKSNSTGWAKLLLSAGSYNISANSTGYLDNKKSIDIAALSTNYENIVLGSANLSINAISIISGNSINDFSINITEISLNKKINKSTDDGSLILSAITGVYNVTIISDNFAYDSQTINILAADTLPNITFSLYTRNSINITIYDEETQKIINDTTTTLILNNLDSIMQTLYTSNGTIYKDDLFGGLWDIAVFNDFYTQRNYFVTIVDDTHTTLDVWLLNSSNGEAKTFNIRNQEDEPLEDVFMTITNKVNDTYVVVAQKYSDISGQLSIFLKSTTEYRIMLEAAGYTTKIFDLEPASSLYNIILSTDVDIPFTTIYDKVSYSLTTTEGSLNFSIITSSIGGFISFFGLNSSFDGINYLTNVTGSVGGGTASIIILNSSNSTGRTIDIDYFIKLNGEDLINLHNTYYTYNATAISNYSALSVAEKYKGDFSGVMLAVISILVVVAIVATFAELGVPAAISGFAGAIILFVFSILGWLPILMTSSILIIVIGMFLFRRGD